MFFEADQFPQPPRPPAVFAIERLIVSQRILFAAAAGIER
jgi:hypothetical protein